MDRDDLTPIFLIFSSAFFVVSLIFNSIWSILFNMAYSGQIIYEILGILGLIVLFAGALVIIYFLAILLIILFICFAILFVPAYLLYQIIGLEFSIIFWSVIAVIGLIYLLETHSVSVENYTITIEPKRSYILKR